VTPAAEGKWTDLVLPLDVRRLFRRIATDRMIRLDSYGSPELGTVTGSNPFFALSEATRHEYGIETKHLKMLCPPGTKHLKGLTFTRGQWEDLKIRGERVWLLHPHPDADSSGLLGYIAEGERLKVDEHYKCTVREPWWRPPAVSPPDLFFTYMSHRYPRLVTNAAGVTFVNSMHGVRLRDGIPKETVDALPILALNSATMLGAEIFGRSYGGGILKMEPREAAALPVPTTAALRAAWGQIRRERSRLDTQLREGQWAAVVERVDAVLLSGVMQLPTGEVVALQKWARTLRERRMRTPKTDG
jgi:adenine-specific DNA-methyltransferase